MPTSLVIRVPQDRTMPDNAQYTHRFQIKSESSDRLYTVAQSKSGGWWSCSCPGWIRHKNCKHLTTLGLPGQHRPFEATLKAGE